MTNKVVALFDQVRAFAREHVVEIAREIYQWNASSMLVDGRLRQMAEMLSPVEVHNRLSLAETMAKEEILKQFIKDHTS